MKPSLDCRSLRRTILKMAYEAQSVHVGCAFSLVEIVSVVYGSFLNWDPKDLKNPNRDIFALSKGHGVMACYAALHESGALTNEVLATYFKNGSLLKGLSSVHCPGVEVSGGSLGHGITVATGMALGAKWDGSDRRVYCVVGDGEINEGSAWESFLFAAHHELSNLYVIVDANSFQAMGRSADVLNLEPMKQKFEAFNFMAAEIDGHDEHALQSTIAEFHKSPSHKPRVIIARTIKGKGVSFMEDNNIWHYTRLDTKTYNSALLELGYES